jgi:hypothetical protein
MAILARNQTKSRKDAGSRCIPGRGGVIEAVRDDARLQKGNSLDQLFETLAQVGSACQAIARAVSAPRAVDFSKCPAALKMSVLTSVRSAGPVYRDDRARRQALSLIEKLKGAKRSNVLAMRRRV